MVNNGVTTTLWERWDSDDQVGSGMNSFNHHQFAYVSEWFYEQLAGIRLDGNPDAGTSIDRVEIAPRVVSGLDWAVGSLATPHGELESRWEGGDERLELNITVPWNTTATVQVPARPDAATVRLAGDPVWRDGRPVAGATREKGVEAIRAAEDAVEVVLGAGEYGLERDQ
jgi:alpha-L-rhamnosidase